MVTNSPSNQDQPRSLQLDAQLVDADGFLARSLNQEERGRRNKRTWAVVIGCLLASATCVIALVIFASPKLFASDKSMEGWQLWRQRRLPQAEAKFREALMENAKDGDAWTGLGWSLTNMGRVKDAMEAFKKALEFSPDSLSAQNGLGQCALGTGDLDLAEQYLKKSGEGVVKLAGGEDKMTADSLPAAWYGLVQVYLLKDDFDQAKQWADRIAKLKSEDETVKALLEQIAKRDSAPTKKMFDRNAVNKHSEAKKLWDSHKIQEALELYRELVKSDPQDTVAQNGYGWCLLNTGNAKAAHETFKQCLAIDPKHGAALNGAGQSALFMRDWATAEEFLKKGSDAYTDQVPEQQRNPQNIPAAWFGLANVHLVQGNFDKAAEWAELILKYAPDNPSAKQTLENARKKDNSEIKKRLGVE